MAESVSPGFDDVWLLGDLFGHVDQSLGGDQFNPKFLDAVTALFEYPVEAAFGNWEYWLMHPELDEENEHQRRYRKELVERRRILSDKNPRLLDKMIKNDVIQPAESENGFTLFHGCSYACHDGSNYQAKPCESYLNPKDLNVVTHGLFENRENLKTDHFLFGHTHAPGYFAYSTTTFINMWRPFHHGMTDEPVEYGNDVQRFGINPGSAGIASGQTPRSALILDTADQTFTYIIDSEDAVNFRRKTFFSAYSMIKTSLTDG
jgi:predicted phosphodiesterase